MQLDWALLHERPVHLLPSSLSMAQQMFRVRFEEERYITPQGMYRDIRLRALRVVKSAYHGSRHADCLVNYAGSGRDLLDEILPLNLRAFTLA